MGFGRLGFIGLASLLVAGGALWAVLERSPTKSEVISSGSPETGAALYARHCASCHGANLEGQPAWRQPLPEGGYPAPPHDPSGHTWHHPDAQLFGITKLGGQATAPAGFQSRMPAFRDVLSDAEIWAVLDFIKSTWPEPQREFQAEVTRRSPSP